MKFGMSGEIITQLKRAPLVFKTKLVESKTHPVALPIRVFLQLGLQKRVPV